MVAVAAAQHHGYASGGHGREEHAVDYFVSIIHYFEGFSFSIKNYCRPQRNTNSNTESKTPTPATTNPNLSTATETSSKVNTPWWNLTVLSAKSSTLPTLIMVSTPLSPGLDMGLTQNILDIKLPQLSHIMVDIKGIIKFIILQ